MPTTIAVATARAPLSIREVLGAFLDRIAVAAARNGSVEPFGL